YVSSRTTSAYPSTSRTASGACGATRSKRNGPWPPAAGLRAKPRLAPRRVDRAGPGPGPRRRIHTNITRSRRNGGPYMGKGTRRAELRQRRKRREKRLKERRRLAAAARGEAPVTTARKTSTKRIKVEATS